MQSSEAMTALEAKRDAEAQMARAANCPPWRHAVFGLMMGALVASFAFDFMVRTVMLVAILAAIPLIVRSDRKRMGMFINGYRRGKTRYVIAGYLALWLPLYAVGVHYGLESHDRVVPLVAGVIAGIAGIVASMMWQRVFVREMGA